MNFLGFSNEIPTSENLTNLRLIPYEIRPSSSKGFGLYATQKIPSDTEIMSCVAKDLTHISPKIPFSMAQYLFAHPDHFSSNDHQRCYLLVCGEMVFLNHCDVANCSVSWTENEHGLLYAQLSSKQTILNGDELTIRYTDACDYRTHGYI